MTAPFFVLYHLLFISCPVKWRRHASRQNECMLSTTTWTHVTNRSHRAPGIGRDLFIFVEICFFLCCPVGRDRIAKQDGTAKWNDRLISRQGRMSRSKTRIPSMWRENANTLVVSCPRTLFLGKDTSQACLDGDERVTRAHGSAFSAPCDYCKMALQWKTNSQKEQSITEQN